MAGVLPLRLWCVAVLLVLLLVVGGACAAAGTAVAADGLDVRPPATVQAAASMVGWTEGHAAAQRALDSGDPAAALRWAQQALDQAAGKDTVLARAGAASALRLLATAQAEQGHYDAAHALQTQALALARVALGEHHPDLAEHFDALGTREADLGRRDAALALKLQSLTLAEAGLGQHGVRTARIVRSLAETHNTLGQHALALPLAQRAVADLTEALGPTAADTGEALIELGDTWCRLGQHDQATPTLQRGLSVLEAALGADHSQTGWALNNLGACEGEIGRFAEAVPLHLRALAIIESRLGPDHPLTSIALNNLVYAYSGLGQTELALPLQQRVVAIRERTLGPMHPLTATALNNLAQKYFALGRPAEALPLMRRALDIRARSLPPDHPELAAATNNIASVLLAVGEPDQALAFRRKAYIRYVDTLGTAHPDTVFVGRALAAQHLALGDRPLAIALFKDAVNGQQTLRARVAALDPLAMQHYKGFVSKVYLQLASALTDAGRLSEAQQALDMLKEDEYFNFVERSGADAGATRMATSGLEQDWLARYQAAGRQAAALEGSDGDDAFQAALDELRAQMRKTPAGAVAQSELAAPSRTALRRLLRGLGRGVVLLQAYHVDDRLVTIVTSAGTQTAQVTPVDQRALNRQIFEFRRELRDPRSNPLPSAQALYQLLLAPVAGHLERIGARTVMLSLDGPLRYLPFGALHDGQRYALERWALPLYTAVAPRQLLVAPTRPWHVAALGVTRQLAEFAALPGVDAELARIVRPARSQPQSQPSTGTLPGVSYLNEEFTAQRLRDVGQQRHPVLHVATHFKFNPGTESASFMLLGDGCCR